jgi:surface antigen
MRKALAVCGICCVTALAGCAAPGQQGYAPPGEFGANKTTAGTLLGAGLGAFAGSKVGSGSGKLAATAIGGLLGAVAGHSIGSSLDQADLMYANRAGQQAFEYGRSNVPVEWRNPDTGHAGTVTPVRTYETEGRYCREYQQTIVVGGQTEQAYGTACRQPDGSWQIQG